MRCAGVSGEESRPLLALAPGTTFDDLNPTWLSEVQMLRISSLVGIYKALRTIFGDVLADQWVRRGGTLSATILTAFPHLR